ncbi:glycosyltransferase [Paludibacter sp. 221]|uniref:glycosyltransferase n=1 Tax=Paludibacter sp. 221 TaxID=2302939 RepID=UPI0013D7119F|nr:glycosyltransferase [Paludibacter sp. 221]NDV46035.1 glycosyltransferase [Paludibacter sp. 221]
MKKKHMLFIFTALNGGGAEKVLINIFNYFDYTKYQVDLCLLFNEGVYLNDIHPDVTYHYLYNTGKSKKYFFSKKLYKLTGLNFFLRRKIRKKIREEYDTIISFAEGTSIQFHQFLLDRSDNHITWVHTNFVLNHWTAYLFRKKDEELFYNRMNKIVFVSHDAMKQFNTVFNIEESIEQKVIYNLIDVKAIQEYDEILDVKKKRFTICSVGRLTEVKSFDKLINVVALLKDNDYDVDVWLLGDGTLKKELEQQVKRMSLEDNIYFLGFKNPPYAYMKNSDVFVSTSQVEGFPLVLCEALSLGLPIVSTKTTGPVELLLDDEFGVLTKHDEGSIFEGLRQLIDDEKKREYYSEQALKRASSLFDIDKTMNEIYSLFKN